MLFTCGYNDGPNWPEVKVSGKSVATWLPCIYITQLNSTPTAGDGKCSYSGATSVYWENHNFGFIDFGVLKVSTCCVGTFDRGIQGRCCVSFSEGDRSNFKHFPHPPGPLCLGLPPCSFTNSRFVAWQKIHPSVSDSQNWDPEGKINSLWGHPYSLNTIW